MTGGRSCLPRRWTTETEYCSSPHHRGKKTIKMQTNSNRFGSRGRPDYQHAAQHLRAWEKIGTPMPAALVMGCEPSIYLAGVAKVPYGVDELAIAGAVTGEPIEVVSCETNKLKVPASAEIVIEGEFLLGITEPEGPFGEFTGYMTSSPRGEPVFKVNCITHRSEPILQAMLSQMPPSESSVCRQVIGEGAVGTISRKN